MPRAPVPGLLVPGAFVPGVFVRGVFVPGVFVAGAFVAGAFVAGVFVAGVFVAGVFVGGVFVAGVFVPGYLCQAYLCRGCRCRGHFCRGSVAEVFNIADPPEVLKHRERGEVRTMTGMDCPPGDQGHSNSGRVSRSMSDVVHTTAAVAGNCPRGSDPIPSKSGLICRFWQLLRDLSCPESHFLVIFEFFVDCRFFRIFLCLALFAPAF